MAAFCNPMRCLSFLGGRKSPSAVEYSPVGADPASKPVMTDDDDDFFTDSWGASNESASSTRGLEEVQAEAKPTGVQRNPTLETTTKRNGGGSSGTTTPPASASAPPPSKPSASKKEVDFFSEMGMEPEYKAPRTRGSTASEGGTLIGKANGAAASSSSATKAKTVSSLLDDGDELGGGGSGWGGEDLDLGL
eukprot:TRINITY_DN35767_c0_g1_i1.p1 TRINITY_DN35767_c0_g1~~TRINITY_DN35767_c0_g1_i1.p1  ORF type:complete len:192 (+),score=58.67 TRINITY_DN35767_c0_g1_i1:79-654(+)